MQVAYGRRILLMVLVALPITLAVLAAVWRGQDDGVGGYLERLTTLAIFFAAAGPVAGALLSAAHTALLRRGRLRSAGASVAAALLIGSALGTVLALAQPPAALGSFISWGALLGLAYIAVLRVASLEIATRHPTSRRS